MTNLPLPSGQPELNTEHIKEAKQGQEHNEYEYILLLATNKITSISNAFQSQTPIVTLEFAI